MTGHADSNWGFFKNCLMRLSVRHTEVRARIYEKEARRSTCGHDAVQYVGGYSGKQGYAITFAAHAAGNGELQWQS
jgi:hypothetical protein